MTLNRYRLGDLIELSYKKNEDELYGINDVKGISIKKKFIKTKANMDGVSLKRYLLVEPDSFCYVPTTSRNGEKITLAHNNTSNTYIVSSSYIVFKIKRKDLIISDYLFIYFCRPEFDRFSRFNSWGSAREVFQWSDMCDINIDLPSIEIQQKYVNIYNSMVENQKAYENGIEDLKLVCDAYIEELRRNMPCEKIEKYIIRQDKRNSDNTIKNVKSISVYKEFNSPSSKVNTKNLKNYKIVEPGEIAFVQTTHNEKLLCCAINNTNKKILVSSVNEVFSTNNKLLPNYLMLYLSRKEFDRYARYHSWGSVREIFNWDDMKNVKIPIPDIKIQKSISEIYKVYMQRKEINKILKLQIKDICPILIKGAIDEAKGVK